MPTVDSHEKSHKRLKGIPTAARREANIATRRNVGSVSPDVVAGRDAVINLSTTRADCLDASKSAASEMANFFLAHLTLRLLRKSEKESAPYELSQAHHDRARSHSGFLPRTGCLSRDADRGSDWRIGWGYD